MVCALADQWFYCIFRFPFDMEYGTAVVLGRGSKGDPQRSIMDFVAPLHNYPSQYCNQALVVRETRTPDKLILSVYSDTE